MACRYLNNILYGSKCSKFSRSPLLHFNCLFFHSSVKSHQEEILPSEWYEKAFSKLRNSSRLLNELDLIDDRLASSKDHSRVHDDKLEQEMLTFKSLVRVYIGSPSVQETMRKNLMASVSDKHYKEFRCFGRARDREPLTVNALPKVADILNITAQKRKLVRVSICPQVTQHQIWIGTLEEILNGLKSEIHILLRQCPGKEIILAQQVMVSCLKLLDSASSYDPESTSWMRLSPTKGADSPPSHQWKDVLEMFIDLINCLSDVKRLDLHVTKLEVMKEGLYQIGDVLIDKNVGYKETRHQENLVQKKLKKALGHSSKCLFMLLIFYLYGDVKTIEVDLRGGIHPEDGGKRFCLYMGKILTSDEEGVVQNGVKQLDKALGLFKFVWEAAGMKEVLELQGHLWCVGAEHRHLTYRGNMFFLHGINS